MYVKNCNSIVKKILFQMLKYRELYPNATESEYLYKKEPRNEKVVRCIKLKNIEDTENSNKEHENKISVEGNAIKKLNILLHTIHVQLKTVHNHLKSV